MGKILLVLFYIGVSGLQAYSVDEYFSSMKQATKSSSTVRNVARPSRP